MASKLVEIVVYAIILRLIINFIAFTEPNIMKNIASNKDSYEYAASNWQEAFSFWQHLNLRFNFQKTHVIVLSAATILNFLCSILLIFKIRSTSQTADPLKFSLDQSKSLFFSSGILSKLSCENLKNLFKRSNYEMKDFRNLFRVEMASMQFSQKDDIKIELEENLREDLDEREKR